MTSAAFHFDAQASLLKKSVAASATTTATLDDTTGVSTCAWEVIAAYNSVVGDWSLSTTTGTSTVVTAPSGSGKSCLLQCKVNGGVYQDPVTGRQTAGGQTIRTALIYIAPETIPTGSTTESDSTNGWGPLVNALLRGTAPVNILSASSGTPTLVGGAIYVLSGTATAATLPQASTMPGQTVIVKKDNLAGAVTVSRSGSDTIDGATSYSITGSYGTASFIADLTAAKWYAFPAA